MEWGRNFRTSPDPFPCLTGGTEDEEAGRVDGNADPPAQLRPAAVSARKWLRWPTVEEMTRLVRVLACEFFGEGFLRRAGVFGQVLGENAAGGANNLVVGGAG
ncbi:hypothetical protein PR202_ga05282 [Eleusine coracana subsp. coracana]|uniref:Uncharacterized protein n=1 Tax=Eleusine coracana subsp. coracana TaxID=191504 RepID=A0AAV5BRT4_ELECO|nr:hypothetical protein PR202_ga04829 [Eleusine coracana subsp. coracana]GJM89131.1 hypothetical protein PR202_ga05282 [Eleusine coracana subsp. coracana]